MICPKCQHENEPTDKFCLGCGVKLDQTAPTTPAAAPAAATQSQSATRAEVTLTYNKTDFPLGNDQSLTIGRPVPADNISHTINTPEDNDKVSSKPITVIHKDGKTTMKAASNTRVLITIKAGEEFTLEPGMMIMAGDQIITVG